MDAVQYANPNRWAKFPIAVSFPNLVDQLSRRVISQALGQRRGFRSLHLYVESTVRVVDGQNVENRQFIGLELFSDDWIDNLDRHDRLRQP